MGNSFVHVSEVIGSSPGGAVRLSRRELGCETFGIGRHDPF
jgi:hypothetical protein